MPPYKKRIIMKCLFCKKKFLAIQAEVSRGGAKYCSQECYREHKKTKKKLRIARKCFICNKDVMVYPYIAKSKNVFLCSPQCHSTWRSEWAKQGGLGLDRKGVRLSSGTKKKMGESRTGKLHWNWKGGISRAYKTGYYSKEYKEWRKKVFQKDNYICQECGEKGCYVTAHHIKSFAKYPKLRFIVSNGKTLCEDCHKKTDNYKKIADITPH